MLSGRGLCDGLITRPEESYRLWCVGVCDLETSQRKPRPTGWLSSHEGGRGDKSRALNGKKISQ